MRNVLAMLACAGGLIVASAPASADTMFDFAHASGVSSGGRLATTAARADYGVRARVARRTARQDVGAAPARRSQRATRSTGRVAAYADDVAFEPQARRRTRTSGTSRARTRVASLGDTSFTGSTQYGIASFYWQPQRVASGGWFNPNAMTAAHRTLPFGTRVRVTHLGNGRSVDVVINDRGPYIAGRIIDLSKAAAGVIGMQSQGIAQVRVDVLGR